MDPVLGRVPGQIVRVPLTRGLFALVDDDDAPRVMAMCWSVKSSRSCPEKLYAQHTYPVRVDGKKATVALHRFILDARPGQIVDHINGDTLDNRRANLRITDCRGNATNVTSSKLQKRGGFKGVFWNKNAGKWEAAIGGGEVKANGKRRRLYLGLFTDPRAAARAYDDAARRHFGEFASLNFPDTANDIGADALKEARHSLAESWRLTSAARRALGAR